MKKFVIIISTIALLFAIVAGAYSNDHSTSGFCDATLTLPHPGLQEIGREYRNGTATIIYSEDPNKVYPMVITTTVVEIPCGLGVTYEIKR